MGGDRRSLGRSGDLRRRRRTNSARRDWRRNALNGGNLLPDGGIGAFAQRRLTTGLDIRLNSRRRRAFAGAVQAARSRSRPPAVRSPRRLVSSRCRPACSPPGPCCSIRCLPVRITEAMHALPMGLAMKVALRATGPDRLDLPLHCSLDRIIERSGRPADAVPMLAVRTGLRAGLDRRVGRLGPRAARRSGGRWILRCRICARRSAAGWTGCSLAGASLVTRWDADPWVRGATATRFPVQRWPGMRWPNRSPTGI